jgi:hypothetical protein
MPTEAAFFCIDGSKRGETICPEVDRIRIGTSSECEIRFNAELEPGVAAVHAEILRNDGGFAIKDRSAAGVIVNGKRIGDTVLAPEDLVQLGEGGPRLRFHVQQGRRKTMRQIVCDCKDITASTPITRPPTKMRQLSAFARHFAREAILHSTRTFRWTVMGALVVLCGLVVYLGYELEKSRKAQEDAERRADRREAERLTERDLVRAKLARQEEERKKLEEAFAKRVEEVKVRTIDSEKVNQEIIAQMKAAELKILDLQNESGAVQNAIERYSKGVCFLVASVYFVDAESGRPLRYVVDEDGKPRQRLDGSYIWTTKRGNPKAVLWYTGTGFLVSKDGMSSIPGRTASR